MALGLRAFPAEVAGRGEPWGSRDGRSAPMYGWRPARSSTSPRRREMG